MYFYDNITKSNNEILSDLKGIIYSEQNVLSRSAALIYSRLGYFSDTQEILDYTKKNKLITDNNYYGYLSYLLSHAPTHDQYNLISKITSGKKQIFSRNSCL